MVRLKIIFLSLLMLLSPVSFAMEEITLAENAVAHMPIVVSPSASSSVISSANKLDDYLAQITGATFQIVSGDGARVLLWELLLIFPICIRRNSLI